MIPRRSKLLSALLLGVTVSACTQDDSSTENSQSSSALTNTTQNATTGSPTTPPAEAIQACSGKAEGVECNVALHGQSIDGTCRKGPEQGSVLACAPNHPPPPPPPAPPPQALDACKTLAEGASCSVSFEGKTLSGICRKGPFEGAALACAPNDRPPPPPPPGHGPPKEALDACSTLAEGAACNMNIAGKTLTGTCRNGPFEGAALACAPATMPPPPPPPGHGPPKEAVDACSTLAEGAACTVALKDKTLAGSCRKGPHQGAPLACAPNDMPPPPPAAGGNGPPKEALDACKTLAEGASCSVSFAGKVLNGSCRKGPGEGAIACVPANLPPPPGPGMQGPPKEALEACNTLAEGASCNVSFGGKSLSGTCRKGPFGGALACAPANMPPPPPGFGPHGPPPGHGPPKEALEACKVLAEGAACTVQIFNRTINGSCRKGPSQAGPLACVPAGFPPPPVPAQ